MWSTELSQDLMTKCEVELGENAEKRRDALELLRKMIREEPGFSPLMDDVFLLCFLRTKKFDVPRAFASLKSFYSYKARYSGYVTDLTPADVRRVLEMDKIRLSPHTDADGGGVYVIHLGLFDLDAASVEELLGAILVVIHSLLVLEPVHVCGMSAVFDFSNTSARHVMHYFRPTFIWMTVRSLMDALPFRIKGIHVVNESPLLTGIYHRLIKPLFPKKMRRRIILHAGDLDSLHGCIPVNCLPESLGGTLTAEDYDVSLGRISQEEANLDRLRRYTYNWKTFPSNLHSVWIR